MMKIRCFVPNSLSSAAMLGALLTPTLAVGAVHANKNVSILQSPDTRECVFFKLSGVAEADAATPGVAWFAIHKSHAGYKDVVAMLILARTADIPLAQVTTTGTVVCGHAAVLSVSL